MTDPEIDRRCHHCGVSIRDQAFFCPQCGEELDGKPVDADPENAQPAEDISKADTIVEVSSDGSEVETKSPSVPSTASSSVPDQNVKSNRRRSDRKPSEPQQALQSKTGPKDQQAPRKKVVVRPAREENVLQKVERLRKVSSIVIEEAGYDPSLRFVLVAAVLFILFVVIVIVSKAIG